MLLKEILFKNKHLKGHPRSVVIKKNIIGSFLVKGVSVIISFLIVPLVLNYVDKVEYGIWLTISSVIHWFGFFNLGLGNGLRNKLAEAIAMGDLKKGKVLVSTTYAIISIISAGIFLIFLFSNQFLDYAKIFNADPHYSDELKKVVIVVLGFFLLRLVLQLLTSIILAFQRSALSSAYELISSILSLVIIYLLTITTKGSLFYLAIVYSTSPALVLLISSLYFFKSRFKDISPSFSYIDFSYAKGLLNLGFLFLINRVNGIILFTTDSMIITQISGPEKVTPYNLTHKYFGIMTMFFEIFTIPLWSAFTDAFAKKEFSWINNVIRKTTRIWYISIVGLMLMFAVSGFIFKIWVGDKVEFSYSLSLLMAISVAMVTYVNVYSRFLNGVSKIRLSTYYSIGQALLNIPLSIFFAKNLNMGVQGVMLATIICIIPPFISNPIQTRKLINETAKGIWNK
jgi:O-antigen/teichoic acid export membrane protein